MIDACAGPKVSTSPVANSNLNSCKPFLVLPEAEIAVSKRDKIEFRVQKSAAGVSLGQNSSAVHCEQYPDGGVEALAIDLSQGLNSGLSCLSQMNGSRRQDAVKLRSLFISPNAKIEFYCGDSQTVVNTQLHPAIILSSSDAEARGCLLLCRTLKSEFT